MICYGFFHRERNYLVLTMEQMTQKLSRWAALTQVAKELTSVHAKIREVVEPLTCIVPYTTGSVQPEYKKERLFLLMYSLRVAES